MAWSETGRRGPPSRCRAISIAPVCAWGCVFTAMPTPCDRKILECPCQDPVSRGFLPQDLEALVDGIRASTLGSKPIGVWISRGFGHRLQCPEMDRLSCLVHEGWDRQRALLAVFLGDIDPLQGRGPIAPPSADAHYRARFLLWGVPEFPIHPGRLLARILGHPFDG